MLFSVAFKTFKQIRRLSGRKITKIYGNDALSFLQGLQTNDISKLENMTAMYTCFLNINGYVMFDLFIYKLNREYLLEYDLHVHDSLLKHILKYKLRKHVFIDVDDNLSISWSPNQSPHGLMSVKDPRVDGLGFRSIRENVTDHGDDEEYSRRRYSIGVAEGIKEIPVGGYRPFPLNFDLLNAISNDKGCYIGQEFVAKFMAFSKPTRFVVSLRFERDLKKNPVLPGCHVCSGDGLKIGTVVGVFEEYILAIVNSGKLLKSRDSLFTSSPDDEGFQYKVSVPIVPDWLRIGRGFG